MAAPQKDIAITLDYDQPQHSQDQTHSSASMSGGESKMTDGSALADPSTSRPPPFVQQYISSPSFELPGFPSQSSSSDLGTQPHLSALSDPQLLPRTVSSGSGYSPTIRSLNSTHPHLSSSYSPRNDIHASAFGLNHSHSQQQRQSPAQQQQATAPHFHRYHHHQLDHSEQDSAKLTIDYDGLDTCIHEASLSDGVFYDDPPAHFVDDLKQYDLQNSYPFEQAQTQQQQLNEGLGQGLDRAASTGSKSAIGGAFRRRSARKSSHYSERAPRPPIPEQLRYTFYSASTGLIQATSFSRILSQASIQGGPPGTDGPRVFSDLLKNGCYWIDILDPSDFDMQVLSKHFHIHPLTIEDISTEEVREKYEVFRNYYFVCFRTFDQDYQTGLYLQPASMYSVVLRDGIFTFHFRPTTHHLNVLRRLEQFHSHITLTPDWINYALMDDITDSFASPIQTIEYEVDSIDELVLLLRENETSDMLRRIGSCRKNVMTIWRLLSNKADVIRGLMKRFDERFVVPAGGVGTGANASMPPASTAPSPLVANAGVSATAYQQQEPPVATTTATMQQHIQQQHQIQQGPPQRTVASQYQRYDGSGSGGGEILLYLGDILDHVLTMLQSLNSYEKILARSHSNYLAQISLEINQLSTKTNQVVSTLTFFASLIVPMTFVAGLWGMNVNVPGQPGYQDEPLHWFYGLIGAMGLYCVAAIIFGKRYGLI
ncbi:CorA metal ion transporter [Lunasporangiospora selenospora]|uniref:CorA metal ion transporter n=1 Tax=Lunasporangiospora selenospora TaxID=979761 RepID=A0A9P6G3M5_9FUNG|nr:CorA metal ion transporter [Lunasporangiospora selenospora]